MILARTIYALVAVGFLSLSGCLFSLPPPEPATHPSNVGDEAPGFSLARTGLTPGKTGLAELTSGTVAVLVFYRGEW
jgi:hypothetical protein